jgi:DNA-binding XRE family transcriptional regulator
LRDAVRDAVKFLNTIADMEYSNWQILTTSTRAGHNLYYYDTCSYGEIYLLTLEIPKHIFNDDYPINPTAFGERLRKARMDTGLQIKELAAIIGVTEDTVINWELRGMRPLRKKLRNKVALFMGNLL